MASDSSEDTEAIGTWHEAARRIVDDGPERFDDCAKLLGLDPALDFRFSDLTGVDFAGCDLSGFDFTGARLLRCNFETARIAGCRLDYAELGHIDSPSHTELGKAADYRAFAMGWSRLTRDFHGLDHLPLGTIYFENPRVLRVRMPRVRLSSSRYHCHLISDSTGETLTTIAKASAVQFAAIRPIEHVYPLIRTQKQLDRVLAEIENAPGLVLYTVVNSELCEIIETRCRNLGVPTFHVLEPIVALIQGYLVGGDGPMIIIPSLRNVEGPILSERAMLKGSGVASRSRAPSPSSERERSSYFHLHLISDSTGETLITIAKASAVQFAAIRPIEHVYPLIRTQKQLGRVLAEIENAPGLVLYTVFNSELCETIETRCRALNVPTLHVLEPIMTLLRDYVGPVD